MNNISLLTNLKSFDLRKPLKLDKDLKLLAIIAISVIIVTVLIKKTIKYIRNTKSKPYTIPKEQSIEVNNLDKYIKDSSKLKKLSGSVKQELEYDNAKQQDEIQQILDKNLVMIETLVPPKKTINHKSITLNMKEVYMEDINLFNESINKPISIKEQPAVNAEAPKSFRGELSDNEGIVQLRRKYEVQLFESSVDPVRNKETNRELFEKIKLQKWFIDSDIKNISESLNKLDDDFYKSEHKGEADFSNVNHEAIKDLEKNIKDLTFKINSIGLNVAELSNRFQLSSIYYNLNRAEFKIMTKGTFIGNLNDGICENIDLKYMINKVEEAKILVENYKVNLLTFIKKINKFKSLKTLSNI